MTRVLDGVHLLPVCSWGNEKLSAQEAELCLSDCWGKMQDSWLDDLLVCLSFQVHEAALAHWEVLWVLSFRELESPKRFPKDKEKETCEHTKSSSFLWSLCLLLDAPQLSWTFLQYHPRSGAEVTSNGECASSQGCSVPRRLHLEPSPPLSDFSRLYWNRAQKNGQRINTWMPLHLCWC